MRAVNSVSAQSRSPGRLYGIETGRGVAASMVVLYHVSRHLDLAFGAKLLKGIFQFGHAGVDFFFVISGFIILFIHFGDVGKPARLAHYLERRFTRLMPTYLVALSLTLALRLMGSHDAPSLADLAWSASLLPSHHEPILNIAWTLQFEVLFYAVFCILILSRTAGLIALAVWLAGTLWASATSFNATWLPAQFYGAYDLEFFLGMTVAYLLRTRTIPHPRGVLASGLLLFAVACALEDFGLLNGYSDIARLAYGIPAAIIVLGIAESDRQDLLRVPQGLRKIGSASYSIYLFQFIFIGVAWQMLLVTGLDQRIPLLVTFAILVIAAIGGGVFMSHTVEYPLMRAVRRQRVASHPRPVG